MAPDIHRRTYLKAIGGTVTVSALAGCGGDGGSDGGGSGDGADGGDGGDGGSSGDDGGSGDGSDGDGSGSTGDGDDDSPLKIGMETHFTSGAWVTALVEAPEFYAETKGFNFNLFTNDQDAQQQISHINQMINQEFDGIILVPWNSEAVSSAVEDARDAGIPVYTVDIDAPTEAVSMNISWSDEVAATTAAEEIIQRTRDQNPDRSSFNVLEVRPPPGQNISRARHEPFVAKMEETDDFEVVGTLNGEWRREVAKQRVREWVNANDAPDAIYSANFTMGLGALNALEAQDLAVPKSDDDHIPLVQLDGSSTTHEMIMEGLIDVAIDQPNYYYGPIALEYLEREIKNGRSALPDIGATITEDDFSLQTGQHKGVEMWAESIWSPAEVVETDSGHRRFVTNHVMITEENAEAPYLWGNIWE